MVPTRRGPAPFTLEGLNPKSCRSSSSSQYAYVKLDYLLIFAFLRFPIILVTTSLEAQQAV